MEQIAKDFVDNILHYGLEKYKDLLFGLILGLLIAWLYHKYIGNKTLKNSYERLLKAKDEVIDAYKEIIGGRLADIEVPKKDKEFFSRLKNIFRKTHKP